MKWGIILKKMIAIVFIVLFLSACGSPSEEAVENNERFSGLSSMGGARVVVDNETGCKYLFVKTANAGGLSPLYNENGEIDCGK